MKINLFMLVFILAALMLSQTGVEAGAEEQSCKNNSNCGTSETCKNGKCEHNGRHKVFYQFSIFDF